MMKLPLFAISALVIGFVLTGCVDSTEPEPFVESAGSLEAPLSGQVEMTIQDFQHHPNQIVAKQGSTLHIVNLDDSGQSVQSDDKSLNTGVLGQNEAADLTLKDIGTFTFYSEPNPNMLGSITVIP